jgi:LacI family transcriptional regulator
VTQGESTGRRARASAGLRDRRPTINDVARMAGVSKKTVSRVINESPLVRGETREAVKAVILETGFTPDPHARSLAFRKAFLVGLIYDNPNPQHTVAHQEGLLDAFRASGLELAIRPIDRTSPRRLADIRAFVERQKPFGVVLPSPVSEDEALVELLKELDCRYVRIAAVPLDAPDRMVVSHDGEGAAEAARHLADLGHRRIALITGPAAFRSSVERRRGFEAELVARGLALDPALIKAAGYTYETGLAAARDLLSLPERPTAIFALNDEMATGVYRAAREIGLEIPRDLTVVGFDDSPIATRIWPTMSSVRLPLRDMGRMAGEMLAPNAQLDPEARHEVRPQLVIRESSGIA